MKLKINQLRRIIKEEMESNDSERFLHGYEEGSPIDDEGNMIKGRMAGLKRMAEEICELTQDGDQFPAWVQDLVAQAHETLSHVHDYLLNDEDMRDYSDSVGYEGGSPLEIASEAKKKRGLWANIHARRKAGKRPKRPGEKGYPKTLNIEK